ncbi:MAG TPA: ATP-binding protein [Thermoplasmata archaeon]|nr:ATP-binding protein [Thermoplasmata archaeon]
MTERGGLPPAILRALQGVADGSGRTVVIAGPEASGKSGLLAGFTDRLLATGVTVHRLRGAYSERNAPYAALRPLADSRPDSDGPDSGAEAAPGGETPFEMPEPSTSRRGRGDRQRGRVLGVSYAARSRGVARLDEAEYWEGLCRGFAEGTPARVAIMLEDGTYVDDASRAFLLYLTARARLRPLVLGLVLDTSDPSFASWEERLIGRPEVDWVRTVGSRIDPREANRVKVAVDALKAPTRRILLLTALMGGAVSEIQLARVSRLTFQELADALLPASEDHLVRVDAGKVTIPHPAWLNFLPELIPGDELGRMHREIAEALEAMHPEPSLSLLRQLADHQYASDPGPVALRYLLESAELAERLYAFDEVDSALARALLCVGSLPVADRTGVEAELRLFRARCLLFAGRPGDAERELREGLELALHGNVPSSRLEEWLEPMVPALQAVGPRPSLLTSLIDTVERLHEAGAVPVEAMFEVLIAENEILRGRVPKGRTESHRTGHLARRRPSAPQQALALLAIGFTRSTGTEEERELADRFLRSAALSFTGLRRPEFEQMAVEFRGRLLQTQGKLDAALALHLRAIPLLQRMRLPSLELNHELGVAEILFDRPPDARGLRAIKRATELCELLHLSPPAPAVARLWLLEGRRAAYADEVATARDYWSAAVDRAGPPVLEHLRAEALLRLSTLELLHGREERAQSLYTRPELAAAFPTAAGPWEDWSERLRALGALAHSGAAAVATLAPPPN